LPEGSGRFGIIETKVSFTCSGIGSMAGVTLVGQNRTDITVELDSVGYGRVISAEQDGINDKWGKENRCENDCSFHVILTGHDFWDVCLPVYYKSGFPSRKTSKVPRGVVWTTRRDWATFVLARISQEVRKKTALGGKKFLCHNNLKPPRKLSSYPPSVLHTSVTFKA